MTWYILEIVSSMTSYLRKSRYRPTRRRARGRSRWAAAAQRRYTHRRRTPATRRPRAGRTQRRRTHTRHLSTRTYNVIVWCIYVCILQKNNLCTFVCHNAINDEQSCIGFYFNCNTYSYVCEQYRTNYWRRTHSTPEVGIITCTNLQWTYGDSLPWWATSCRRCHTPTSERSNRWWNSGQRHSWTWLCLHSTPHRRHLAGRCARDRSQETRTEPLQRKSLYELPICYMRRKCM